MYEKVIAELNALWGRCDAIEGAREVIVIIRDGKKPVKVLQEGRVV